jgi:hypothetical protein
MTSPSQYVARETRVMDTIAEARRIWEERKPMGCTPSDVLVAMLIVILEEKADSR